MTYAFDAAFQEKVATFFMRDETFAHSTDGLISSSYFENETLSALVWTQADYWASYKACPSPTAFVQHLKDSIAKKRVTINDMVEAKRLLGVVHAPGACDPADRGFITDKIVAFARTKAIENATLEMADAVDQGDDAKIEKAQGLMTSAFAVGAVDTAKAVTYNERLADRVARRKAQLLGTASSNGITTGNAKLDEFLFPHFGFGRKEMSIFMGPPKSGKTAALVTFAVGGAAAGKNVFYASCEVSEERLEDRVDACISGVPVKELAKRENEVLAAVDAFNKTAGLLEIQAFPTGQLKVSELRRILLRYKADGIEFDELFVDYIDIMAPERRENDKRHELSQIARDLRALAIEFNLALVTATQTNREGTRKAQRNVTDGTDAAEDYDKVRLADVLITINASVEERQNGEVVLYFSEMRNTEGGLRLRFNQEIDCMRFITAFVGKD